MNVLDFIPIGIDNRVTREYIAKMTGLDDRTVRAQIEHLRLQGVFIISSNLVSGYWQPETKDEITNFIHEYSAKWQAQAEVSKAQWKALKEMHIKEKTPADVRASTSASEISPLTNNIHEMERSCQE